MAEALAISAMAIATVFTVLVLLMLAMNLSAFIFERIGRQENVLDSDERKPTRSTPTMQAGIQQRGDVQDEEVVSAVLAAMQAADISLPAGGRIRIEKVSRSS